MHQSTSFPQIEQPAAAALTTTETATLAGCEEIIKDRGRRSFVEVGKALATIRDSKLYRETHDTFEAYCKERWQISRPQAYRQIEEAQTIEVLSPNGDTLPEVESHVRPLLQFPLRIGGILAARR